MKRLMLAIVIGVVLVFLAGAALAANSEYEGSVAANNKAVDSAADYTLTWFTLDSGGGRSSGGDYVLEGTAGQPDAGLRGGGGLLLTGGFWGRQAWINTYLPVFKK